jgi:hypothetical protein
MIIFFLLLVALILFDLAAMRWGVNSMESIDSCEWERREAWVR